VATLDLYSSLRGDSFGGNAPRPFEVRARVWPGVVPGTLRVAVTPSLRHLSRYRKIAVLLVRHFRQAGVAVDGELVDDLDAADDDTTEAAEQLATELEAMGPTFIKLGQLLSTRSDLLSPPYLTALARLQDDVEPFGFAEIEATIEQELGVRISQAFQHLDHVPLATASLGQVHRATLRDGRPVAVKVQRPGVREQVRDDMEVIEELAGFLDDHTNAGRRFGLSDMVAEFKGALTSELDYRQEAEHLRVLGAQLEDEPLLVVPQPIDDFTTSSVLTMELVEGRNVSSLGPLAKTELDGAPLADALLRAYLRQILEHGFVHADPHPGNVLVTTDGRLGLIDLGMVARLAPAMQDSLIRLLLAASTGDGDEAAEVLASIGTKLDGFDADTFRRRTTSLVLRNRNRAVADIEAGALVGDLAQVAGSCGLRPPADLTMIGKALLNLDQVAFALDPDFVPMAIIEDEVVAILRRKMTDSVRPSNVLASAMDARDFVERLPGRVNKVMDALAEGELTLNVQGIDERELLKGIQQLANRVTTGLVVAALIIGAAMIMRIETSSELFGYPALAIVLFVVASVAGLWLIASSLLHDLPSRRRRRSVR
jgi:predicted unusual protein kinase regulating ubiquinone biosynthesis (AarF/ABC1/UbiB family)